MPIFWLHIQPVTWNIAARVWTARTLYSTRARRAGGKGERRVAKTTTLDQHDVSELADTST
jgi:hypothetical protein